MPQLERHPHAELRGERNSNCGAGAKEISESALGDFELLQAGNGHGGRIGAGLGSSAWTIRADDSLTTSVWHRLVPRHRELNNINRVIRAGIVAIEDVEKLGEGVNLPALADLNGACDAQVGLNVGLTAKNIEARVSLRSAVKLDPDAPGVIRTRNGDGTRALDLIDCAQFDSAGEMHRTREHKAMAHVFAGRTVVARAESIELSGARISVRYLAHAINVVEEFAKQASPGLRLRELVICHQTETVHIGLRVQHQRVIAGAVVRLEHIDIRHKHLLIRGIRGRNQR